MRGVRPALVALVLAAGAPAARAGGGVDCHGFTDPVGDASSPSVDVVAGSFEVEGSDLVVQLVLDDLSAPLTDGAEGAEYYVEWEPEYGPFQLIAARAGQDWTFVGRAHRVQVPAEGSIEANTIEMRIDAAVVDDFPIVTDASVATFEVTPFLPVLYPGRATRADLAFANEIAPGVPCPADPTADSEECAVLVDDADDGRLLAGRGSVAGVEMPSPGHVLREAGAVDADAGDATEILGLTAATADGNLVLRLRVADLDAPRWPGAKADLYGIAWWADVRYSVEAVNDDDGWRFSADGAPLVSGSLGDDEIVFEIALTAIPAAAAGRPLTEWYASGASVVADQNVVWQYYASPWFDEAPDDLDPGLFLSGGGCVPDWHG